MGLTLVLLAAAIQPQLGPFPGLLALLPVAGAALILLRPAQGCTQRLLANRPMVWVGELSYSLYLWHWPVLALLRYTTGAQELDMPASLLFIALTLLLTNLSFYAVEAPLRQRRASARHAVGYGLLACAALATAPSMAKINQALSPPPLPVEYTRYADPATICHGQIVGDCLKGDLSSDKEVLVLGDSHAAMLNLFFDQLGKELGFKARIITASSCVTIPGFDYQRIAEWAQEACLRQIKEAEHYIGKSATIFIAGMWSWQLQSNQFRKALHSFIESGAPQAKKYLISQVPLFSKNPLRIQRFHGLGLRSLLSRDRSYLLANEDIKEMSQAGTKTIYLKLDDLNLFEDAPIYRGSFIYYDESHMNEIGVLSYAGQSVRIFKSILMNNPGSKAIK